MKLEDLVYKCINEHPGLYWTGDCKTSRILVLEHLFLVIGNGFGWTPDGYLIDVVRQDKEVKTAFDMGQGGWYAIKAPKYGTIEYTNRDTPATVQVYNFTDREPYQKTPGYIPNNIKDDYRRGLEDVMEWVYSFC